MRLLWPFLPASPTQAQEHMLWAVWARAAPFLSIMFMAGVILNLRISCHIGTKTASVPSQSSIPWSSTVLLPPAAGRWHGLSPKIPLVWGRYWRLTTRMAAVLVWEHTQKLWTGSRVKRHPYGLQLQSGAYKLQRILLLWGAAQCFICICRCSMLFQTVKWETIWLHEICYWYWFIHSWRVTEFYVTFALLDGLCHLKACLCSLLFQRNTSWAFGVQYNLQQGTGREWNNCLQTDTAYEGPPRFCSLFLAHNPFPQIHLILLKNVVGESVSHMYALGCNNCSGCSC